MKIEQTKYSSEKWSPEPPGKLGSDCDLALIFGSPKLLQSSDLFAKIQKVYPNASIAGCSTAGEIIDTSVCDDSVVVTGIAFDHTRVKLCAVQIERAEDSYQVGSQICNELLGDELAHVFVLSDGLAVNGSELVRGALSVLPERCRVTGGLAGDGDRFTETFVIGNAPPKSRTVAAIGFYGSRIEVGCGSLGGWDPFGPERVITRSEGNVMYEMDGTSALKLYKEYLGEHAKGLPATGLLFPLCIRYGDAHTGVVRTILAVDEEAQSITFAGDVPVGAYAQLMKANFDRLIDGAAGAAQTCRQAVGSSAELAVLISCVGRKMVLKQRVEEEVEGIREVLGNEVVLAGFYSYGEIAPMTPDAICELHNQTMTITTFTEVDE